MAILAQREFYFLVVTIEKLTHLAQEKSDNECAAQMQKVKEEHALRKSHRCDNCQSGVFCLTLRGKGASITY
ncbi:MAG: hypothetical protein HY459_02145 [Parcubacteria group bacterium]|nr:hypothetical protein [Parcubacteria group bacterium]